MNEAARAEKWASAQLAVLDGHLHEASAELAELRAAGVNQARLNRLYPQTIAAYELALTNLLKDPRAWRRLHRVFRRDDFYHRLPLAEALNQHAPELAPQQFEEQVIALAARITQRHGRPPVSAELMMSVMLNLCSMPLMLGNWSVVSAHLAAYWTPWNNPRSTRGRRVVSRLEHTICRYVRYLQKTAPLAVC